jgi:hypothetical protein
MIKENTVCIRIHLYKTDDVKKLHKEIHPEIYKNYAWIPQTLGDQIWLWYEFNTENEADAYKKWIIDSGIKSFSTYDNTDHYVRDMFMDVSQKDLDYWIR